MTAVDTNMIGLNPCEELFRGEANALFREIVSNINGMVHSHGPKLQLRLCRPMDSHINDESTGPGGDSLDASLCHTILKVGTNATEIHRLGLMGACINVFS